MSAPKAMRDAAAFASLLCMALPVVLLGLHPVDDADIWFHLATGRLVLDGHHLPAIDPFSALGAAQHWINPSWLADVVLDFVFRMGGGAGLVILATVLGAFALVIPLALAREREHHWTFEWALLVATAIAYERFFVRPEIFSFALAATMAQLLVRGQPRGKRSLVAMCALQAVWANLHAAFLLGPGFALLALAGEAWDRKRGIAADGRRPAWISRALPLLLLLACCVTPYGPGVLLQVLSASRALGGGAFRAGIVEWQPTFFGPVAGDFGLMTFVASLPLVLLCAWVGRRSLRGFEILLAAAMITLGFTARRHLVLYAVTVLPLAARWAAAALAPRALRRASSVKQSERSSAGRRFAWLAGGIRRALAIAAALFLALMGPGVALLMARDVARGEFYRRFGPPRSLGWGFSTQDHPVAAGEFVASHGLRGPLFNNVAAGSYLIWRLQGDPPVFVDGRLLDAQHFQLYRQLLLSPPDFDRYATAHGFRLAVFGLQPNPPVRLFRHLYESQHWRLVFLDGEGAVFVSADVAKEKPDLQPLDLGFALPPPPESTSRGWTGFGPRVCDPGETWVRGQILVTLGYPIPARSDLMRALVLCEDRVEIGLELSTALLAVGQPREARRLVEHALDTMPSNAAAWVNLGLCFAAEGDTVQARQAWERALAVHPPDPRAEKLLRGVGRATRR